MLAKNYDWNIRYGMVVINKRNIRKFSLVDENQESVKWISKYGTVTFNQYGREFPCGGMNETGLVIELMWLDEQNILP